MNKLYILLAILLVSAMSFAQSASGISYQAIVRDSGGALLVSQAVGMQISILEGSSEGTAVYSETQSVKTNSNGLLSLEIGAGTTNGNLSSIDWSSGSYFIKTETDPTGGSNYSITGTSRLTSVPYAMQSKKADNGITGQQVTDIATNKDKIGYTEAAVSANTDVEANTLKVGYTEAAVSANTDVAANTAKKGITTAQADIIDNTSGANTGDNATNTQYSNQSALIIGLQAQIAELISDNTLVSRSVAIGTQKWMNKNLEISTYRDGTLIPEVTDAVAWAALKTGAWCYYVGTDGTTYGKLYNWYAVMGITVAEDATPTAAQIAARKQLAPTGWHAPSDGEWRTLTTFLDQEAPTGNVGGKMKETGTAHWRTPNGGANNSSGFTGLPGGYRSGNGTFTNISNNAYWWSSTENDTTNAWGRALNYDYGNVFRPNYGKAVGFSVRCLRD